MTGNCYTCDRRHVKVVAGRGDVKLCELCDRTYRPRGGITPIQHRNGWYFSRGGA